MTAIAQSKQERLDVLVNRLLVFVDQNGTVISKSGSPMTAALAMEYRRRNLFIAFSVATSAISNGTVHLTVKQHDRTVFSATGNYLTEAFNCQTSRWIPGTWERLGRTIRK